MILINLPVSSSWISICKLLNREIMNFSSVVNITLEKCISNRPNYIFLFNINFASEYTTYQILIILSPDDINVCESIEKHRSVANLWFFFSYRINCFLFYKFQTEICPPIVVMHEINKLLQEMAYFSIIELSLKEVINF